MRSSLLGILFSILILCLLFFQFINSDIFYKLSPIVISQSIKTAHASRIDFNQNTSFLIALADRLTGERINDPTIFTLYVTYYLNYVPFIFETTNCTVEDV